MALKIKVNERRTLQFEVQIGGIDYKDSPGVFMLFWSFIVLCLLILLWF